MANFFQMFGGMPGLELLGLEGSTAPYECARRMNLVEVGQVGELRHLPNPTEKGT
ncbi:MAG: hypothetical protein WCH39_25165 [Schlesneria sp.]